MDVFDVTQSERIQFDELGIGFDAKFAQTRQMTKGMWSDRDKASINNRQMSKLMKTLEMQWRDRSIEEGKSTWKSSVFKSVRAGLWRRSKRKIDWVNDVRLSLVDRHERGNWVIVVEELQSIVFGWAQVQSLSVLNRCGQLLFVVRSARSWTKGFEWIRMMKKMWYWLKWNDVNQRNEIDRCWTYVINHVYLPIVGHESVDPNRKRLNK